MDGVLLSWFDCVALGILHEDYPSTWRHSQKGTSVSSIGATPSSFVYDGLLLLSPTPDEIQRIEDAIARGYADLFDQSGILTERKGPEMVIELKDDVFSNSTTPFIAAFNSVYDPVGQVQVPASLYGVEQLQRRIQQKGGISVLRGRQHRPCRGRHPSVRFILSRTCDGRLCCPIGGPGRRHHVQHEEMPVCQTASKLGGLPNPTGRGCCRP